MKKYDVIIIGAGPAGLTAGLYSARNGLKTAIISKDIGGTANSILRIENWPGYSGSGAELVKQFYEQVRKYEIDFIIEEVVSVESEKENGKLDKSKSKNKEFIVKTKKQELGGKALIIATGTERKKLQIPGEVEFLGKGVSYCATCDAFFFKNRDVAVIGGSDCATTSALALADIAKKVYLIYRGEKLRCENINEERLNEKKNVEIFYNSFPLEILGKEKVEGLKIMVNKKKEDIKLDGIFIEIGSTPLGEFAKNINLKMDEEKFIHVNDNMKTSVEGIYAAGDVTNGNLKQVLVASSQGAIAAKSAYDWLNK
jgi:thioredoxin reductase (NADPH)